MIDPENREDRRKVAPIVPSQSVAGRTLMFLVAIMTFLSCVTFGGVALVQKSAIAWSADVGREVTIQIRPVEGELMDANLRLAESIAEETPGVANAHALSIEESEALLKPWLGEGLDLTELRIPRLVVVELSDPNGADMERLSRELTAIKGASLDTHAAWRQQLNTMAGTIVVSGIMVLLLILAATVLAVIFATRGTMASNRDIVDVLHFIGASNRFVAGEFQGRFLMIGLRGGVIGGVSALGFFTFAGIITAILLPGTSGAQINVLFGSFSLGFGGIAGIVLIVPVIAGLTAMTSGVTVRRFLAQIS
ncbi:cell division protein FtsX [Mariluticola halotolerans]|uniref:cell division protein FtsX n=1 Tax=Mariluticola halotolerans TaxID=2909283 RepID=UPI0026E2ECF8|nr:ABC transporter permease [Mariluticola halotolerans]UJQ93779.1 ABC transporter permease [Mariluticola halotolerans]